MFGFLEDRHSLLPMAISSNGFHESTMWSRTKTLLLVIMAAATFGYTSTAPTVDPDSTYLSRSIEQARGGISVAASVLHKGEVEEIFGARLDLVGIQPVWLKIQNLSAHSYVLFLRSIDPDYFSPYEVARRSSVTSEESVEELYPFIRDLEIQRFITPGSEVGGYVYTHADEGLKAINVDLVGNRRMQSFNMLIEVPGLRTDFDDFDRSMTYQNVFPSLDEDELRSWLAALPCCTSTLDGILGDPVNLVLVGAIENVRAALVSQQWDVTAEIDSTSIRRIMTAFIFGSRYRYAPVSDLYLFGRAQDMSFQKARRSSMKGTIFDCGSPPSLTRACRYGSDISVAMPVSSSRDGFGPRPRMSSTPRWTRLASLSNKTFFTANEWRESVWSRAPVRLRRGRRAPMRRGIPISPTDFEPSSSLGRA